MKRFLFLTLILGALLPFSGVAQGLVNDSKRRNWSDDDPLFGNVASVRTYTYYATATDYAAAGDMVSDETYRFNAKGDVAEYTTKYDISESRGVYTYDANRKPIKLTLYSDGELSHTTTYDFDAKGRPVKSSTVDAMGSVLSVCVYKYNSDGTLASTYSDDMTEWDNDEENVYTYNSQGKLVGYSYSSSVDAFYEEYEYNSKGQCIKLKSYWDAGLSYAASYRYNAQGQLIESIYSDEDGKATHKLTYKYDANGNRLEVREIDMQTNTVRKITKREISFKP